jgi:NADPH:quinone reductase-like Zn-dependent oxidoreductase
MRVYRIAEFGAVEGIQARDEPAPVPGPGQVLVRLHARSLNRRDLQILHRAYPVKAHQNVVPVSDGAGTVLAVGDGVRAVAAGDQVLSTYFPRWRDGRFRPEFAQEQFGCTLDGMLADCVLADESAVVQIPPHLSFEEAATLPCAALTAWSALTGPRPVLPGETVLTIGTGGVALFAVQFALLMGARVAAVTAGKGRADLLWELGAHIVVDRTEHPDWEDAVRAQTDGGVDHVVETGALETLPRSVASCAAGGHIALAAALGTGMLTATVLGAPVSIRRFYVGSRRALEAMLNAVSVHRLRPVIDVAFSFDEAREAYRYFAAGGHFGKIVIGG